MENSDSTHIQFTIEVQRPPWDRSGMKHVSHAVWRAYLHLVPPVDVVLKLHSDERLEAELNSQGGESLCDKAKRHSVTPPGVSTTNAHPENKTHQVG